MVTSTTDDINGMLTTQPTTWSSNAMAFFCSCAKAPLDCKSDTAIHHGPNQSDRHGIRHHASGHLQSHPLHDRQIGGRHSNRHDAHHALGRRTDQTPRRRSYCADHARSALRLCLSGINDAQFVIYHLCMHPEHTDKLRDEAAAFDDANFNAKNEDMAYLGSFIKETLRSSPGRL
jgi:hypothetical protein